MAMGQQCALSHAIRLASALSMLASVMTAPIRPPAPGPISNPDHLRRHFVEVVRAAMDPERPPPADVERLPIEVDCI